jgi:hypothetical protein
VMMITGLLLFASEAQKSYGNMAFRVKILLLILAGLKPSDLPFDDLPQRSRVG